METGIVSLATGKRIIFFSTSLYFPSVLLACERRERSISWALLILCDPWESSSSQLLFHPRLVLFPWPALVLHQQQTDDDDGALTVVSWDQHSGVWLIPEVESQVSVSYFTHTYTLIHTKISKPLYTKHWSTVLTSVNTCIYICPLALIGT